MHGAAILGFLVWLGIEQICRAYSATRAAARCREMPTTFALIRALRDMRTLYGVRRSLRPAPGVTAG